MEDFIVSATDRHAIIVRGKSSLEKYLRMQELWDNIAFESRVDLSFELVGDDFFILWAVETLADCERMQDLYEGL